MIRHRGTSPGLAGVELSGAEGLRYGTLRGEPRLAEFATATAQHSRKSWVLSPLIDCREGS
jgi:hypothetical protein